MSDVPPSDEGMRPASEPSGPEPTSEPPKAEPPGSASSASEPSASGSSAYESSGSESSGASGSSASQSSASERSTPLEENLKRRSTWIRLVFMIVLWVLYQVAEFVAGVVIIIQFLWVLFTGKKNPGLVEFGQSLSTYVYQVLRYLTFNSEERPFPFDLRWPGGPPAP